LLCCICKCGVGVPFDGGLSLILLAAGAGLAKRKKGLAHK